MSDVIHVGVAGHGYWGQRLSRVLAASDTCTLVGICEYDEQPIAQELHRDTWRTADFLQLLALPDLDAVALATPAEMHFPLALAALRAGKHVFVEKPLALTADHVDELCAQADASERTLMVDHVYLFGGPMMAIGELFGRARLPPPTLYRSARVNMGAVAGAVGVIFDLVVDALARTHDGVHTLRVSDAILDRNPITCPAQTLIPRHVWERVGPFIDSPCQDYDYWLRITRDHAITFHADRLARFRAHSTSMGGPSETRGFVHAPAMLSVWRAHRARCDSADRKRVNVAMRRHVRDISKTLVSHGLVHVDVRHAGFFTISRAPRRGRCTHVWVSRCCGSRRPRQSDVARSSSASNVNHTPTATSTTRCNRPTGSSG